MSRESKRRRTALVLMGTMVVLAVVVLGSLRSVPHPTHVRLLTHEEYDAQRLVHDFVQLSFFYDDESKVRRSLLIDAPIPRSVDRFDETGGIAGEDRIDLSASDPWRPVLERLAPDLVPGSECERSDGLFVAVDGTKRLEGRTLSFRRADGSCWVAVAMGVCAATEDGAVVGTLPVALHRLPAVLPGERVDVFVDFGVRELGFFESRLGKTPYVARLRAVAVSDR